MDELIARLVDKVGIDGDEARRAIGIIFGFIKDAGPRDKVDRLMDALPEAEKVESPFDGSFSGSMGAMAAFNALTAAGLNIQQIQGAVREIVAYAKERAGEEPVDEVVRSIPGLSGHV